MKQTYELSGGTVTREGKDKWRVNAPDGREVGLFKTRKQALAKAEQWDKWDALASIQDLALTMMPYTTTLTMAVLGSIKDGKLGFMPTDEQIQKAVTLDVIYGLLRAVIRTMGKQTKEGK
jgi:hypothetical protein